MSEDRPEETPRQIVQTFRRWAVAVQEGQKRYGADVLDGAQHAETLCDLLDLALSRVEELERSVAYLAQRRAYVTKKANEEYQRVKELEAENRRLKEHAKGWGRSADAYMEALHKLEEQHGELKRDYDELEAQNERLRSKGSGGVSGGGKQG